MATFGYAADKRLGGGYNAPAIKKKAPVRTIAPRSRPPVPAPKPAPRVSDPIYGAPISTPPAPHYGAPIGAAPAPRVAVPKHVATPARVIKPADSVASAAAARAVADTAAADAAAAAKAKQDQKDADEAAAAKKKAEDEADAAHEAEIAKADDHLQTQLDAIAARWNMTREQLEADDGEAGRQYRAAKMALLMQRDAAIEQNMNSMLERGIIQSGLTLQGEFDIERDKAIGVSGAVGTRDYERAQIAAQRASIPAQQTAEEATATASHEAALRDLETMRALATSG